MAQTGLRDNMVRPLEGFYASEVRLPRPRPLQTFLPMGYEPNYPYPLIVFLHGHGSSEERVLKLAPKFSRRNFICIALRGNEVAEARPDGRIGYSWNPNDSMVEDYVFKSIEQTRRQFHVHSERIFLAGICEGASQAYGLSMSHGPSFAGLISLNGCMPRVHRPLLRPNSVRHLQVFIGHGMANSVVPLSLAKEDQRLLYSAGLDVSFTSYPTNNKLHEGMFGDVNRWVIDRIQKMDA
ncbi:MAG: hypothetical protein NTV55_16855 [Planctomycetota bacterium]|nr:hypothetical protein [Planctomycetota bacterium]